MSEPVGNGPRNPSDVPGNSHKARQAQKPEPVETPEKLEKVIEGKVIRRKSPWYKKVTNNLVAEDAGSVGDFLLESVLLPAFRNMVRDVVVRGTDQVLYGSKGAGRPAVGQSQTTGSLRTQYRNAPEQRPVGLTAAARSQHNFDSIVLPQHQDALNAIESLAAHAIKYGSASVADLYDILGISGEWTDTKWGWTDLASANLQQTREGWLLVLPPTQQLR